MIYNSLLFTHRWNHTHWPHPPQYLTYTAVIELERIHAHVGHLDARLGEGVAGGTEQRCRRKGQRWQEDMVGRFGDEFWDGGYIIIDIMIISVRRLVVWCVLYQIHHLDTTLCTGQSSVSIQWLTSATPIWDIGLFNHLGSLCSQ